MTDDDCYLEVHYQEYYDPKCLKASNTVLMLLTMAFAGFTAYISITHKDIE